MIEELVARIFATRNAAHLAHWAAKGTGSLSRHLALGDFYDGLIDKIDVIVEMYQGAFGLIDDVDVQPVDPKSIIEHIKSEANWIQEHRDEIADGITPIENVLDDLIGSYLTTYYKLKNLQ